MNWKKYALYASLIVAGVLGIREATQAINSFGDTPEFSLAFQEFKHEGQIYRWIPLKLDSKVINTSNEKGMVYSSNDGFIKIKCYDGNTWVAHILGDDGKYNIVDFTTDKDEDNDRTVFSVTNGTVTYRVVSDPADGLNDGDVFVVEITPEK